MAPPRRFWLTIRSPRIDEAIRAEAAQRDVSLADVVNDRLEHCATREAALLEEIERWRATVLQLAGPAAPPAGGSVPPATEDDKW
jgi:hypothetical protein